MALETNKADDKAFEQSIKEATKILAQLEAQAKRTDKAINGFGETMDKIAYKNKFSSNSGRFIRPQGDSNQSTARNDANALKSSAILNKLNKSAIASMPKQIEGIAKATGKATPAITLLVGSIYAMEKAGKSAYNRNMEVKRSLEAMRQASDDFVYSSGKQAAEMNKMSAQWKTMGEDINSIFEPIFGLFISAGLQLTSILRGILPDVNNSSNYTGNNPAALYASDIEKSTGISATSTLGVLSGISSGAQQKGFDAESALNLAIGTYNEAIKKADELGLKTEDVAKELASAWQTGAESAKQYGVVLNDNVLRGWMSERGIDATREMSEAMMQSYRYQLMQEQLASNNDQALSENIKKWTQLGDQINEAKSSLFAFDEVINTTSKDTSIPTIGKPSALDTGSLNIGKDTGLDSEGLLGLLAGLAGAAGTIAALMKLIDMLKNWKKVKLIDDAMLALLPGLIARTLATIPSSVKIIPVVDQKGIDAFKGQLDKDYPRELGLNTEVIRKELDTLEKYLGKTYPYNLLMDTVVNTKEYDKFKKVLSETFPYEALIETRLDTVALNELESILNKLFPYEAIVNVLVNDEQLNVLISKLQEALSLSAQLGVTTQVTSSNSGGSSGRSAGSNSLSNNTGTGRSKGGSSQSGSNMGNPRRGYSFQHTRPQSTQSFYGLQLGGLGIGVTTGLATGGIGTKEMDARLFEGNKKEAVIPLETSEGIDYLANAMREAGAGGSLSGGDEIHVHLSQQGFFDTNDTYLINKYADLIGNEILRRLNQRGGA